MKEVPRGGNSRYSHNSHNTQAALEGFVFANMSPEARAAVRGEIISPTVNQLLQLAGIELDDLPSVVLEDLMGPTKVGDLDSRDEAFFFTGRNHPVLLKARRIPSFVTFDDLQDVHSELGIQKTMATRCFSTLIRTVFSDPDIPTFGNPNNGDFTDKRSMKLFAVRRRFAQLAMTGGYPVDERHQGTGRIFSDYGRALMRGLFDPERDGLLIQLGMELEQLDDPTVNSDDPRAFKWGQTYTSREGIGYSMKVWDSGRPINSLIWKLLDEIGATKHLDTYEPRTISEQAFVTTVNSLCTLDKSHVQAIKSGNVCKHGVHASGLTAQIVQKARAIASCIVENSPGPETESDDDEINLLDPDLQSDAPAKKRPGSHSVFQW